MTSPFEGHDFLPAFTRLLKAESRGQGVVSRQVRAVLGGRRMPSHARQARVCGAQPPVRGGLAWAYGRLMDELQTMKRTQIAINSGSYFLAPGEDLADLKRRIEHALRAGGGFVDFRAVGDRSVSVLVSAHSHVVITVDRVSTERSDDTSAATQFEGVFDLL